MKALKMLLKNNEKKTKKMTVEELQKSIEVIEFMNETKFGNQCESLNVAIQLMQKEIASIKENANDTRKKS